MKAFLALFAALVVGFVFSTAHAEQTEYKKIDTFLVSRNVSTQNKIELNIGGAKNGSVDEVLHYLIKAGVPRKNVEGDLVFKGAKQFSISLVYFSLNMLIEPTDYFSTATTEAELAGKESLGIVNVVSFGGAPAKFLTEQMAKAGVAKVPYKGDANSYKLSGKLVSCDYSQGVLGYVCELTMPLDPAKYVAPVIK